MTSISQRPAEYFLFDRHPILFARASYLIALTTPHILLNMSPAAKAKGTPIVPESVLKKQATQKALTEKRTAAAAKAVVENKKKRSEIFKRARTYHEEYAAKTNELIQKKRAAKASGSIFVPAEAKVAFVVRIRGITGVPPKQKKILQLFRLRQIHNGVFIKLNKATVTMLRLIEPYVAYGSPSLKTVQNLVYKRGFGKVRGQRIPLADNSIVEKVLGRSTGLICVEDIIHEIYTCGPNFKKAANFLWPFQLSSPLGGFKDKKIHFNEGGDAGNRQELIGGLVDRMI